MSGAAAKLSVRIHDAELIDQIEATGDELRRMLRELELVNRFLGGIGPPAREILQRCREIARCELLDVGSGGGDLLRALARKLDRHGIDGRLVGIDAHPATCLQAQRWTRKHVDAVPRY
ncbi:MAG: hypothetical protein GF355_01415, partial [Candidatus Eisenbacteria bacterium]|nr:hypothetical protein [Candidatus Eisenbacteria bacterium]